MPRAALPPALKALNAGISLPPDLIRRLSREAFGRNQSKSALAQEIFRRHFQRQQRQAVRRIPAAGLLEAEPGPKPSR